MLEGEVRIELTVRGACAGAGNWLGPSNGNDEAGALFTINIHNTSRLNLMRNSNTFTSETW